MNGKDFNEVVNLIVKDDPRYDKGAYHFVRQALDHTLKKSQGRRRADENRHVSGRELSEGIRDYALEQYGPMVLTLFQEWGLKGTEDFGEVVFNLVEYNVFGKTENDRKEDFKAVYDFEEVFSKPFQPMRVRVGNRLRLLEAHEKDAVRSPEDARN